MLKSLLVQLGFELVFNHFSCGMLVLPFRITFGNLRASQVAQWVKNLPAMQEIWVRSLGQEDSLENNPLQYSCLEDSMVRGAWWATVHGVAKS